MNRKKNNPKKSGKQSYPIIVPTEPIDITLWRHILTILLPYLHEDNIVDLPLVCKSWKEFSDGLEAYDYRHLTIDYCRKRHLKGPLSKIDYSSGIDFEKFIQTNITLFWKSLFCSQVRSVCMVCRVKTFRKAIFGCGFICYNCKDTDYLKEITKTNLQKEFKITPDKLVDKLSDTLFSINRHFEIHGKSVNATYFLLCQVNHTVRLMRENDKELSAKLSKSEKFQNDRKLRFENIVNDIIKEIRKTIRDDVLTDQEIKDEINTVYDYMELAKKRTIKDRKALISEYVRLTLEGWNTETQTYKSISIIKLEKQKVRDEELRRQREVSESQKSVRRQELVNALENEGLTLRRDSKLCQAYIDGSNVKSIDEIVIVMKKMAVIHERLKRWLPDMRRVAISNYTPHDIHEMLFSEWVVYANKNNIDPWSKVRTNQDNGFRFNIRLPELTYRYYSDSDDDY